MISIRVRVLFVVIVLLIGFVGVFGLLGAGSYSDGGSFSESLLVVDPEAQVGSVPGLDFQEDIPVRDLPPESNLDSGGQMLRAGGEVIGVWEPQRLFAGKVYGFSGMNRSQGPLFLTDGNLLKTSRNATLKFRYGGDVDTVKDFFDVLAFKVEEGDLWRGSKTNTVSFEAIDGQTWPTVLPSRQPEVIGEKIVKIPVDLAPGVYIISVAASVNQGAARYNFRVAVE